MVTYYAVRYAYGSTVINNGLRADEVHTFRTRQDRSAWVDAGPRFDGPGYRESVRATDPLVRAYRRANVTRLLRAIHGTLIHGLTGREVEDGFLSADQEYRLESVSRNVDGGGTANILVKERASWYRYRVNANDLPPAATILASLRQRDCTDWSAKHGYTDIREA